MQGRLRRIIPEPVMTMAKACANSRYTRQPEQGHLATVTVTIQAKFVALRHLTIRLEAAFGQPAIAKRQMQVMTIAVAQLRKMPWMRANLTGQCLP